MRYFRKSLCLGLLALLAETGMAQADEFSRKPKRHSRWRPVAASAYRPQTYRDQAYRDQAYPAQAPLLVRDVPCAVLYAHDPARRPYILVNAPPENGGVALRALY